MAYSYRASTVVWTILFLSLASITIGKVDHCSKLGYSMTVAFVLTFTFVKVDHCILGVLKSRRKKEDGDFWEWISLLNQIHNNEVASHHHFFQPKSLGFQLLVSANEAKVSYGAKLLLFCPRKTLKVNWLIKTIPKLHSAFSSLHFLLWDENTQLISVCYLIVKTIPNFSRSCFQYVTQNMPG